MQEISGTLSIKSSSETGGFPKKKTHTVGTFSVLSNSRRDLIFLQSVAQNTFSASQGVRDIDFLSWTTLSCFPQVSCKKEGHVFWLCCFFAFHQFLCVFICLLKIMLI